MVSVGKEMKAIRNWIDIIRFRIILKENRIMSVGKEMKAIRFRIIIMDKWVEAILIKTNLDI
jgi:hypothetical protein